MKKIIHHLALVGSIGSVAFAAPFLALGDSAELFVTADSNVAYNDNVLLSQKDRELTDTIFTVIPGLDMKYGKDSAVKGDIFANSTLTSYADHVNLNNQLLGTGATSAYEGERVKLKANASFNERDQATVDNAAALANNQGKLLEHHDTAAGLSGEFHYSEKISFGTGVDFTNTDYKSSNAVEQKTYSVPVNVYYELTPKVDVSTGMTYTRTELAGVAANQADLYDAYYYNVGARGAFTPKLSGTFSVGYNTRNGNVGPDENGSLGSKASLAYAYSEKTQLTLGVNRDFANATSGGSSYQTTDLTLGASSALTVDWRVNAALTYRTMEYANSNPSFTNDYLEASVGATYTINEYLTAGASYVNRSQTSDLGATSEFSNNLVTLSLSARY